MAKATEQKAANVTTVTNSARILYLNYNILCGDAADKLKEIPTGSVDCIFTSPNPITDATKLVKTSKILGDQCKRVLKPQGSMWVHMEDDFNEDGSITHFCSDFEKRMNEQYKWMVRGRIIWYMRQPRQHPELPLMIIEKKTMKPIDTNRFRLDYSYLYHFTQGRYGYHFDSNEFLLHNTSNINSSIYEEEYIPKFGPFETGFSESLIQMCLSLSSLPGGTVLDPFCGTGTTGKVALQMGRRFIGIEKDENKVPQIEARLKHI